MRAWRDALWALRERLRGERILPGAIGIGLALLFGVLVWSHHARTERSARRAEQEQLLEWMQAQAPALRAWQAAHPPVPAASTSGSLVADVSADAQALGLVIQRTSTETSGAVTISLDGVRFDRLLPWLDELTQTRKLGIEWISITRADEAGLVNTQIRVPHATAPASAR